MGKTYRRHKRFYSAPQAAPFKDLPLEMFQHCDPVCIECGQLGVPVHGLSLSPNKPRNHNRVFVVCPCGAFVGCHPGTTLPMGRPCGPATSRARHDAHKAFDPIWNTKASNRSAARVAAYKWLSEQLGIEQKNCHISWMDEATCRRIVEICLPELDRLKRKGRITH